MNNHYIIQANKFSFVRNDAANAFQIRTFPCCSKCDTESTHLHTVMCVGCTEHTNVPFYWTKEVKKTLNLGLSFGILCGLLTHFPSVSTIQFQIEEHTVPFSTTFIYFIITLNVQNHVKHSIQCHPFVRKYCTYVVVCMWCLSPKKRRRKFYVCICRCSASTETIRTCIFIFMAGRDDFLCSWHF